MGVTNEYLAERLKEIDLRVVSLDNAIRGANGNAGIMTRMAMVEQCMVKLSKLDTYYIDLRDIVASHSSNIDILAKSLDELVQAEKTELADEKTKPRDEVPGFGSWAWFRGNVDKIIWTVVTVILTTAIIFLLEKMLGDFGFH